LQKRSCSVLFKRNNRVNLSMRLFIKCNGYFPSAIVTNHLRASYGVYFTKYFTKYSTAPIRRPAGGRKNRTIFGQLLDIVWCPVKLRYYLKFHGDRTAF